MLYGLIIVKSSGIIPRTSVIKPLRMSLFSSEAMSFLNMRSLVGGIRFGSGIFTLLCFMLIFYHVFIEKSTEILSAVIKFRLERCFYRKFPPFSIVSAVFMA
jgi:hypothetical protein